MIRIERIYEKDEDLNEYRILTDRIWPRGISKVKARLDDWTKDIAPTNELRKWFNHEPAKFPEFKLKYEEELRNNPNLDDFLQLVYNMSKVKDVVLLYGAKDERHNQAVILCEFTKNKLKEEFSDGDK
ncbi:DUF488 family protein [Lactobacillus sp. S2-2]|uniref:DUF488 domain-containing protein n=1 Tax=Lactobacillus sp. S2-2 TaxID=2692917 RepID=UPI001F18B8E4|nr:DUF488 family protein [Lactobacillus sp. S2-2]MCF6514587.1 DUF488 family protein [Lactobacillus sp. S2-2]